MLPENDEFSAPQFSLGLQLWGGTGAHFGSLDFPGGIDPAFDSITWKHSSGAHPCGVTYVACGSSALVTSGFVAKDYGSAVPIGRAVVYGVRDQFGLGVHSGDYTLKLYASNAASGGVLTSPVLMGQRTVTGAPQLADGSAGIWTVFNTANQAATYRYWAVEISKVGGTYMLLAQVRFYTANFPTTAPTNANTSEGPWRWVWTVPANWDVGRIHMLSAGGGGGGGGGFGGATANVFGAGGAGGWYGVRRDYFTPGTQYEIFIGRGGHRGVPGLAGTAGQTTSVYRMTSGAPVLLMEGIGSPGGEPFGSGAGGGMTGYNERLCFPSPPGPGGASGGVGGGNARYCGGAQGSGQSIANGGVPAGEVGVPQGCGGGGGGDRGEGGDGSTGQVRFERC